MLNEQSRTAAFGEYHSSSLAFNILQHNQEKVFRKITRIEIVSYKENPPVFSIHFFMHQNVIYFFFTEFKEQQKKAKLMVISPTHAQSSILFYSWFFI